MLRRPPRSPLFPYTTLFRSRPGQTIQFQRRDATAATEDMVALLSRAKEKLGQATIYGACLCSCKDRKSTRLNSSHEWISYAVFCLKKKKSNMTQMSAKCYGT